MRYWIVVFAIVTAVADSAHCSNKYGTRRARRTGAATITAIPYQPILVNNSGVSSLSTGSAIGVSSAATFSVPTTSFLGASGSVGSPILLTTPFSAGWTTMGAPVINSANYRGMGLSNSLFLVGADEAKREQQAKTKEVSAAQKKVLQRQRGYLQEASRRIRDLESRLNISEDLGSE